MKLPSPTRRRFLGWLLGSLLLTSGLGRGASARTRAGLLGVPAEAVRLAELIQDGRSARAVARAAQVPCRRRDAPALAHSLCGRIGATPAMPREELARALRERIRRDFEVEDTLRAGGWILSRTEVELAALAVALR